MSLITTNFTESREAAHLRFLFLFLLVAWPLTACSDSAPPLPTEPPDAFALEESFAAVAGEGGAAYACRLVRHTGAGAPIVEEQTLNLKELGLSEAPDRRTVRWEYRVLRANGSLKSLLACEIPHTQAAVGYFNELFGVGGFTTQCGTYDDPCDLGEIRNSGSEEDDGCDPYLELDFSCDDDTCMESLGGGDEIFAAGCGTVGGGGGGDTGGGGGGGDSGGSTADGSLSDDADVTLSLDPPDCSISDLKPQEQAWCDGNPPTESEASTIQTAVDNILARCDFLAGDWSRAKSNVRLFTYTDSGYNFGGAAPLFGDWILASYEWVSHDPEVIFAHELLHLNGLTHEGQVGDPEYDHFVETEKTCSGGRSALER